MYEIHGGFLLPKSGDAQFGDTKFPDVRECNGCAKYSSEEEKNIRASMLRFTDVSSIKKLSVEGQVPVQGHFWTSNSTGPLMVGMHGCNSFSSTRTLGKYTFYLSLHT